MKEKWERKKDGLETIGASIWEGMDMSSSLSRLMLCVTAASDETLELYFRLANGSPLM
jgi:hypothetical protein